MNPCPTKSQLQLIHQHSTTSLLDAISTVSEYIAYAKTHGLTACGLTDHGVALGLHSLITKCNKVGIKPMPGVEFYLSPHPDAKFEGKPYDMMHITIVAKNQVGYKNLIQLSSRSWMPGRVVYKWGVPKPRIAWEDMELFREGLVCGSGCIEGPIAKPLLKGEQEHALRNASHLVDIFGRDNLFMEIMPHSVNKDYSREELFVVETEQGTRLSFRPSDTVMTPDGRLTVTEVRERGITDIWDPIPKRSQDGTGMEELDQHG